MVVGSLVAGALVANGLAGGIPSKASRAQAPTVRTSVGMVGLPTNWDEVLATGIPAKIAFVDTGTGGLTWCMTTTPTGPSSWSVSGTLDLTPFGAPCGLWSVSGTITSAPNNVLTLNLTAINCVSDGCTQYVDCLNYTGTWFRGAGSGTWINFCAPCSSPLFSGTWSGISIPPPC